MTISHTRQRPRHKLQTALPRVLRPRARTHLPQIVDVEQPGGHRDDEHVPARVHVVHTLGERERRLLWGGRARVPGAEGAVRGAGEEGVCEYER